MRLVSRLEFLKMPAGTIFSRFNPEFGICSEQIRGIFRKGKTITGDASDWTNPPVCDAMTDIRNYPTDFFFETLFPPDANYESDFRKPAFDKTKFMGDNPKDVFVEGCKYSLSSHSERDGEFDEDEKFIVWTNEDIVDLIQALIEGDSIIRSVMVMKAMSPDRTFQIDTNNLGS